MRRRPFSTPWMLARHDEAGGASIVAVISLGAALSIVLGAVFLRSSSQLNAAADDRSKQRSIQIADAGIDDAVARLSYHGNLETYPYDPAAPASFPDGERAWALEKAAEMASTTPSRVQPSPHGEWVHILPDWTGPPPATERLIYSVGYIPTRAQPRHIRVIRAEYDATDSFDFGGAILTDGNLPIQGNPVIGGSEGSAHANGDIIVGGSNVKVSGSLTAENLCAGSPIAPGNGQPCQPYQPHRAVPTVIPREHYHLAQFVLCPSGQVLKGPAHTSGTGLASSDVEPCTTGEPVGSGTGQGFNGWKWTATGPVWSVSGGSTIAADGVYYVYRGSASITGGGDSAPRWFGTVIAEASAVGAERSHCPHTGGDVLIAGNRKMTAHSNALGLLAVAGRDLTLGGNATGARAHEGIFAAHEQFRLQGDSNWYGAIISNDGCDTTGSPVTRATTGSNAHGIHGNPSITHDGDLDPPFAADSLRVTRWIEL